jgi:carbonic anhydrase
VVETYDEILEANAAYVASGQHRALDVRPARQLTVITCMDARIAAFPVLGLELGDAHVIRTAGARVTDDVLRSLALSTHVLGTRRALVIGHTRCGLHDPDGTIDATLTELMGRPPFNQTWGTFADPIETVRSDCRRLLVWPDRPEGFIVAGYLLDVDTGALQGVVPPTEASPVEGPPA